MSVQIKETEATIHEERYQDLIKKIKSWPDWKMQSFCLDQTDLRLLREIMFYIPEDALNCKRA